MKFIVIRLKLLNQPTPEELGDYRILLFKKHLKELTKEEIQFAIKIFKNRKALREDC